MPGVQKTGPESFFGIQHPAQIEALIGQRRQKQGVSGL
jgi:hypothetical protein